MKKSEVFNEIIRLKNKFLEILRPSDLMKHDGKSFTRKRNLTLDRLLTIILRCSPFSLQIRLDDFFEGIGCKEETVSKQAFSKSRTNLEPEIVKESFLLTTKTILQCDDLELFKDKFRLCTIDGSDVVLDNAPALLSHFGGSGRNSDCATAMVSLCYDPLNNVILDGGIYPYGFSERDAARNHFAAVSALPIPKNAENLYIFDRGYPSKELIGEMIDAGLFFLMRVRRNYNAEFEFVGKKKTVYIWNGGKAYKVRVFHVTLESGETEILITNVSKKYINYKDICELYFKRWKIEIKFDSLKNKLELENMSGRRPITVYQDFWAKLDMANTMAALEYATNEAIETKTVTNDNKHEQITNENRLITKFSNRYLELLTKKDPNERLDLFNELVSDISKRPSETKPGRIFPRKPPRKKKFCDRRKRVLC
jgi:hypothetical protein